MFIILKKVWVILKLFPQIMAQILSKCVSVVKLLTYSLVGTPRHTSPVRYFNNVLTMIFIDCVANYINIFVKIFILACWRLTRSLLVSKWHFTMFECYSYTCVLPKVSFLKASQCITIVFQHKFSPKEKNIFSFCVLLLSTILKITKYACKHQFKKNHRKHS